MEIPQTHESNIPPTIHVPKRPIHAALQSTQSQQQLFHFLSHPLGILVLFSPPSLPLAAEHGWFGSAGGIFGSLLALGSRLWHEPKPTAPRNATPGEASGTGRSQPFHPKKTKNKGITALVQGDGAIPGGAQAGSRHWEAWTSRFPGRCQEPSHPTTPPPTSPSSFFFPPAIFSPEN